MTQTCNKCGNEFDDDFQFCPNCGTKVSMDFENTDNKIICPRCKSENDSSSKFCGNCGFNLEDDFRETFTTAKRFSNAIQENSSDDFNNGVNSIKEKGSGIVNDNLPDSFIEKGSSTTEDINNYLGKLKAKTIKKSNEILNDNLPPEYVEKLKNGANEIVDTSEQFVEDTTTVVTNIHEYRKPIQEAKKLEKQKIEREKWEQREQKALEEYDLLAKQYGIDNEEYFITAMGKNSFSESTFSRNTFIDGFFIIKDDKFLFEEIGNRDFNKTIVGSFSIYFDQIVSMRLIKSVGGDRYEDITKSVPLSLHDAKLSLKTSINSVKSTRFKDIIFNSDSKNMFDKIVIKMIDNTVYEVRLPSIELGQNLVQLFESWKKDSNKVVVENTNQSAGADELRKYNDLLKEGIISEEEFEKIKEKILFGG